MNLQLEKYIFKILENQKKLKDYLGDYKWEFDMNQGLLVFTRKTGELIVKCPIQIIGTEGYKANSWMWSWANKKSGIPDNFLQGVNEVKQEAERSNQEIFLKPEIELSENLGARLSIICAGFLNHFAYFACPYGGGCMYVTLEKSPIEEKETRNVPSMITTIQMGISSFEFNHKDALLYYLGEKPVELGSNKLRWDFENGSIDIEFDEKGRIANLNSSMRERKNNIR